MHPRSPMMAHSKSTDENFLTEDDAMQKITLGLLGVATLFLPLLAGCVGHPQPRHTVERYLDARINEAAAKSVALDMLSKKSREALASACEPTKRLVKYEIISQTIIDGESIVETRSAGASGIATNDTQTLFVLKQEGKAWKIYKIGDVRGLVNLETWHSTKGPIQANVERIDQDFPATMMRAFESRRIQERVTAWSTQTLLGQQFEAAVLDMGKNGASGARQAIDQLRKTIETQSSKW